MKSIIIIAIAFIFLFVPISVYADLQIDGTIISGSSDSTIVTLKIQDTDGTLIWEKALGVDTNFEIEMPRLAAGNYMLFIKHGAIGGESEILEFTYSGLQPSGVFELVIELPTSDGKDFGIYADLNQSTNFQNLRDFILNSDEPIRALEVIVVQMRNGESIANVNLNTVSRWTSDGQETLEYGIFWTELRAHGDINGITSQILGLIDDGMDLEPAFDFFNYVIQEEPTICPAQWDPICGVDGDTYGNLCMLDSAGVELDYQGECVVIGSEPEEEQVEEEQIECEEEVCVEECNSMPNCTVTWEPKPLPEPEPEKLGIASFVDQTKDPQSYVDRYNNEPTYKEWFDSNFPEYSSIYEAVGLPQPIPEWVRGVFVFWANGQISDAELTSAIAFLVESGIIVLDDDL